MVGYRVGCAWALFELGVEGLAVGLCITSKYSFCSRVRPSTSDVHSIVT